MFAHIFFPNLPWHLPHTRKKKGEVFIYYLNSSWTMALKLLENEQIICSLKKTGLIWITPSILGFLLMISYSVTSQDSNWWGWLFVLIFLVWLIVELVQRIRYAGYITNKRIVLHFGLFLHEREIRFEQIEGINVERYKSIFWHQVEVTGLGWSRTLFDYAGNYDEFKNAIYEAREKASPSNI